MVRPETFGPYYVQNFVKNSFYTCPKNGDKLKIPVVELSFLEGRLMASILQRAIRSSVLIIRRALGSSVNTMKLVLDITQVCKTFCSRNHLDVPWCSPCPYPKGARDPKMGLKDLSGTNRHPNLVIEFTGSVWTIYIFLILIEV